MCLCMSVFNKRINITAVSKCSNQNCSMQKRELWWMLLLDFSLSLSFSFSFFSFNAISVERLPIKMKKPTQTECMLSVSAANSWCWFFCLLLYSVSPALSISRHFFAQHTLTPIPSLSLSFHIKFTSALRCLVIFYLDNSSAFSLFVDVVVTLFYFLYTIYSHSVAIKYHQISKHDHTKHVAIAAT